MNKKILLALGTLMLLFSCGCVNSTTTPQVSTATSSNVRPPKPIGTTSANVTSAPTTTPTTTGTTTTPTTVVTTVPATSAPETTATPTTSIVPELTDEERFEIYSQTILNSKPTVATTVMHYNNIAYGVNLMFTSTLKVEYGFIIESEYSYSYQKLNELSLDGTTEMISTYSGVLYGYNKNFGQYSNDKMDWYVNGSSATDTLSLNFDYDYFENVTFDNHIMRGDVLNGKEESFISGTDYEFANMSFGCLLDDSETRVQQINLSYDFGSSASVDIITTYSYETVEVTIPGV